MPTRQDVSDSLYRRYLDLLPRLSESDTRTVDYFRGQAAGYVWGRQDAGESEHDTAVATDFGYAYGAHCARYALGEIGSRNNLRTAYASFCAYGECGN